MINKKYLKNLRSKEINTKNDFIFNLYNERIIDSLEIINLDFQKILILGDHGTKVEEYIKKKYKNLFKILSSIKVRYRFVDKDVILENWGKIIELDENENLKQIRHSPRLDYVSILEKKN